VLPISPWDDEVVLTCAATVFRASRVGFRRTLNGTCRAVVTAASEISSVLRVHKVGASLSSA
jgi:hypothetical protein